MHCLRWWLPIFLLPLPAASPFLTLLFVATYAIRTRPCAYCSVIILGLMFSTCAFYSYVDLPNASSSSFDQYVQPADPSASTQSSSVGPAEASASDPTAASSCWIDLTCGFLSKSNSDRVNSPTGNPVGQLGWWSAPTRRRYATVLRQKVTEKYDVREPANPAQSSSFIRLLRQWYDRIQSDGIWIGFDKDAGFRLKFIAD